MLTPARTAPPAAPDAPAARAARRGTGAGCCCSPSSRRWPRWCSRSPRSSSRRWTTAGTPPTGRPRSRSCPTSRWRSRPRVDCAAVRDGALLLVHHPAAPRPDRRAARGPAPHRRPRRRRSHQQRRRPRPRAARPRPVHGHRHLRPARHHRRASTGGSSSPRTATSAPTSSAPSPTSATASRSPSPPTPASRPRSRRSRPPSRWSACSRCSACSWRSTAPTHGTAARLPGATGAPASSTSPSPRCSACGG